ncbi:hypothetical protein KY308_02745, partial [Candidatus Woesearchaeota archaeon]|nr:hypothetical protein [Candidatus Woesearchaeota archaeon]
MNAKELAETLHPYERAVLPLIGKNQELRGLVSASKLQEIEVRRALQWLENKKLISTEYSVIQR